MRKACIIPESWLNDLAMTALIVIVKETKQCGL